LRLPRWPLHRISPISASSCRYRHSSRFRRLHPSRGCSTSCEGGGDQGNGIYKCSSSRVNPNVHHCTYLSRSKEDLPPRALGISKKQGAISEAHCTARNIVPFSEIWNQMELQPMAWEADCVLIHLNGIRLNRRQA
jgi:hypothetical protein